MCGIAGIVSQKSQSVDVEELRTMCAAMVSRGPDDEGAYVKDGAGLAMRRLSIIDLETGHQPVSNEDGSIWVVLNGEIYNYRQLRSDLERRGNTVEQLPQFSDVEQVDDAEYRTRGSATYEEDGESEQRIVRCIVRVDDDGTMRVASVRFGG